MVESKPVVELLKKKILAMHKENKNNVYMIDGKYFDKFQVFLAILKINKLGKALLDQILR